MFRRILRVAAAGLATLAGPYLRMAGGLATPPVQNIHGPRKAAAAASDKGCQPRDVHQAVDGTDVIYVLR